MPFTLANFRRYVWTPDQSEQFKPLALEQSDWDLVETGLKQLITGSKTSSLFSGLPPINVKAAIKGQAYYSTEDDSLNFAKGFLAAPLYVIDNNGGTFALPVARIVFHELVHALYDDAAGEAKGFFFNEERAVFLENAIFTADFGGPERVSHYANTTAQSASSVAATSASAVDYLGGFTLRSSGSDGTFRFESGSNVLTKVYERAGTSISGTNSYNYDHYISITFQRSSSILSASGVSSGTVNSIIPNAVGSGFTDQIAIAKTAAVAVQAFISEASANEVPVPVGLTAPALQQTAAKFISAERFADTYDNGAHSVSVDYAGPVAANTSITPAVLAIDGSALNGAILFGASGYNLLRVDATNSVDDLKGGSGADLLLAGAGTSAGENVLNGGGGADVLIGRDHSDYLIGGAGNDVFVGGLGADKFDGGSGFDIVTYNTASSAIKLDLTSNNLSTIVGFSFDLTENASKGDRMSSIEGIIGTDFNDVIVGGGFGTSIFGGNGNDTLTGRNGDYLFGGEGMDTLTALDGGAHLYGGGGYDILRGGAGVDHFNAGGGYDEVYAGYFDIVDDADYGDNIFLDGLKLMSGSMSVVDYEQPPIGTPPPSGTYRSYSDGHLFTYVYDADAHTLTVSDANGTLILNNFQSGDGQIYLSQYPVIG